GYNTRNKTMILGTYLLIPLVNLVWSGAYTLEALRPMAVSVAYQWFLWTGLVVAGRVAYLLYAHGPRLALRWFGKLATDPLTHVTACPRRFLRPAEHPPGRAGVGDEHRGPGALRRSTGHIAPATIRHGRLARRRLGGDRARRAVDRPRRGLVAPDARRRRSP